MSLQLSTAVRNARLDQIELTIGTAAKLLIYSGAQPANCAAADPSGLLATITLPSDYLAAASNASKAIANAPWTGVGSAAGNALSFRIKDSGLTTCHMQGGVNTTGGAGGELVVDNVNIAIGQTINVTAFTLSDANG